MKYTKLLIFITIIFLCFLSLPIFAKEKVVYPDSRILQPPPPDVYPDISGNINMTEEKRNQILNFAQKSQKTKTNQETIDEQKAQDINNTSFSKNTRNIFIFVIIILSLISIFMFVFIKNKPKTLT